MSWPRACCLASAALVLGARDAAACINAMAEATPPEPPLLGLSVGSQVMLLAGIVVVGWMLSQRSLTRGSRSST